MKIEIRPVYYLTLLLLLCAVSGCTKSARSTRAVSKGDREFAAGRYERAEILYLQALQFVGLESEALPDVYLKLGQVYHAQGRWLEAMGHLNEGLKRRTNDIPSKAILGESLFFTGLLPNAFQVYVELLQAQPGHPGAMVMLVDSAGVDSNNLTHATLILRNQSETAKKTAAYLTAQGTLLLRAREIDSAEKEYLAALGVDPQFNRAHLGMANVHITRKDPEKAKAAILAAMAAMPNRSGAISACLGTLDFLGDTEEAKRVARDLVQKHPDFLPPYFFLANSALKERLYDDSLAYVQKALVKAPANFVALSSCGDVYLARNEGTNALRYYQQAASMLKTNPPPLLVKMGYAYFANNDLVNAKASFRAALDADKTNINPEAALALSNLVNKQKDASAARELTPKLEKLTEQHPEMLGGYLMLADLYLTQTDLNNAIRVTQHAQNQFTNVAELHYRLGYLHDLVKQKPEARKAYKQALELAPDNLVFLHSLIMHDLANDRFEDADKLISERVKEHPDSAPLHYLNGLVLWECSQMTNRPAKAEQDKKVDGAISAFKESIRLGPTNQEPYFALVQVYKKTGRQREALQQIHEYLSNSNNITEAKMQSALAAHLLAAQIHEESKHYTNAAAEYQAILAMNQRSEITILALNNLACLYNDHLDKVDEAYALAQSARELAPREPSIAETLGWVVFKKGDYSRALTLLQEAAADPKLAEKPDYLYHVGMANYMLGAEEDAREAFQKALAGVDGKTNTVKVEASIEAAAVSKPSWVEDAKSKLSNLSLDASAAGPGLKELQPRLTAMPNDPILLKRLGMVQERQGEYLEALKSYEAALKSNPKHIDIRLRIAMLYAGPMNELVRGLKLAKEVKDDARNDPKAILVVGQLAYRSGEYRLAVALLEGSADNYPDDVVLSYYLGAARYSVGRVLDAEQPMRKAAESGVKTPQGEDAQQFLSFMTATSEPGTHPEVVKSAKAAVDKGSNNLPAMMLVAVNYEARNDYTNAVKFYASILKDYPLFTPASRNLGLLYFSNTQDRDKGYDLLSKVQEQYSKDVVFCRALGILACRGGDYNRAVQLLQSNAEPAPEPEFFFYLGKAQFNLKRTTDAQRSLNRAKGGLSKDLEQECQRMLASLK